MYTVGVALITFLTLATNILFAVCGPIIIARAADGIFFSNPLVANLTKSYRGLIISLLNGLLAMSTVVFQLVKKGYD